MLLFCLHILAAISINFRRPSSALQPREAFCRRPTRAASASIERCIHIHTIGWHHPMFHAVLCTKGGRCGIDQRRGRDGAPGGRRRWSLTLNERGVARDNDHNLRKFRHRLPASEPRVVLTLKHSFPDQHVGGEEAFGTFPAFPCAPRPQAICSGVVEFNSLSLRLVAWSRFPKAWRRVSWLRLGTPQVVSLRKRINESSA